VGSWGARFSEARDKKKKPHEENEKSFSCNQQTEQNHEDAEASRRRATARQDSSKATIFKRYWDDCERVPLRYLST
tara:strand:+ start:47 stop:274 length:228 start_codon:yes stop_codon:yes gene_type:complete